MPAAVTLVRSTYTDADSFNAAAFNALTASSASVPDATPGNAGVMPATTTAAGLALTNAIDAAAQRTVLGLVIGANVQAYNAELAAIAGLTGAADRLPYFTGPGAAALATFTSYGRTLAALVDAAAGRTALGLVIGTDVQAYSATLAAFAAGTVLTPAQGGTGVNNASRTLTLAGNVTHAGAFTQSFTATGNTALTLPTTGTLATLAGTEALSNKTITASAFNGTVGATTPSTVAATTVTASGAISTTQAAGGVFSALSGTTGYLAMVLQNTGGTSYFGIENSTGSVFNATPYAAVAYAPNEFDVIIGNVKKAAFTSTGLNSTAIGATTPSTGAFTTLSATGNITADSSTSAIVNIDRGSTSDYAVLKFRTAGADANGWEVYTANTADPSLIFYSYAAGVARMILNDGLILGNPTGGDKGAGTLNVAGDIYKNNTAYTNPDYVLEKWATGSIVKFADKEGAKNYDGLKPLAEVEAYARANLHLPRFGQSAGHGIFSGSDALLASTEELYLYLFEQAAELQSLRARVAHLEAA